MLTDAPCIMNGEMPSVWLSNQKCLEACIFITIQVFALFEVVLLADQRPGVSFSITQIIVVVAAVHVVFVENS